MNTDFQTAYLKSLNLIKQDEEEKKEDKKEEKCEKCGKETCECDDTDAKKDEVISDDVDEQEDAKEADADTDDATDADTEGSDDTDEGQGEGEEDVKEQGDEEAATCFCFKTTNQSLIDAINSGFDKVVFTVKAKDDEGNDTTTEVEFTGDDFADFEECDECEDEADDESDDVTDDDLADDIADLGDDAEGSDDDFDDEDMSFESVFKRYYGSLVSENK